MQNIIADCRSCPSWYESFCCELREIQRQAALMAASSPKSCPLTINSKDGQPGLGCCAVWHSCERGQDQGKWPKTFNGRRRLSRMTAIAVMS